MDITSAANSITTMATTSETLVSIPNDKIAIAEKIGAAIVPSNMMAVITMDDEIHRKMSACSDQILSQAKLSDAPDIADVLRSIRSGIKTADPKVISEKKPGMFMRLLGKTKSGLEVYKERFSSVKDQFDVIEAGIIKDRDVLIRSFSDIESLAEANYVQFQELNVMIRGFEIAIDKLKTVDLPAAQKNAESGSAESVQALKELDNFIHTVEKKYTDMMKDRLNCIHTAMQIMSMKNNVINSIETYMALISSGIGNWKKNVSLRLINNSTSRIADNGNQVLDISNQLERENADLLKDNTIKITKLAERGSVDYETLEYVNTSLIDTIDTVEKMKTEAETKRKEELKKIVLLEQKIKDKSTRMTNKTIGSSFMDGIKSLPS